MWRFPSPLLGVSSDVLLAQVAHTALFLPLVLWHMPTLGNCAQVPTSLQPPARADSALPSSPACRHLFLSSCTTITTAKSGAVMSINACENRGLVRCSQHSILRRVQGPRVMKLRVTCSPVPVWVTGYTAAHFNCET